MARSTRNAIVKTLGPVALLACANVAVCAETISISGTGAGLGTMQLLAQEYSKQHPGVTITVLPNMGSTGGIKAALAGALDIGISSRPLKPEERERGGTAIAYAKTPFVIATAAEQRVMGLTLKELAAFYSGAMQTWPDGQRLRLILRPANDSDTDVLKALSPEMNLAVTTALATPGLATATTDQDSADTLEKIPGALGSSTLALILSEKRALKALALEGVAPSIQSLKDGRYPYHKTLYIVTKSNPSNAAQSFIAFVRSVSGQQVLTAHGQWPLVDP